MRVLRYSFFSLLIAALTGTVVAFFLWSLDIVTTTRWQDGWLLFLLPLAGLAIHFLYQLAGKNAEGGNNLVIDEIHEPGGGVPARMTPLILVTTLITHLFGGSAGREGTAVQMGGSIAAFVAKIFKISSRDVPLLLTAGVAGGFGAVFGTPVTGAVFALEVITIGRINHDALLPALLASIAANLVCAAWGVHHTLYSVASLVDMNMTDQARLFAQCAVAGICFGLAARLFSVSMHSWKEWLSALPIPRWLIPVAGGCLIIVLTYLLGTRDYLGLGVTNPQGVSIVSSFQAGGAGWLSWFWKLLFTVITLGCGFKGGEVTPLFFIGTALGNTIATITGAPVDLMAALGFIAIFAGATNTPIACTIMGVELFGGAHALHYAIACFLSYLVSGPKGIYRAQRIPDTFRKL